MKIPLVYPKIPDTTGCPLKKCIAYEKYDGTNLHWVWEDTLGWYAFGTRRDRFDLDERGIAAFNEAHPGLSEAVSLFEKSYKFLPYKYSCVSDDKEVTIFTEFLGDKSFAGTHQENDPKRLIILDASIIRNDKQYMAPPMQFAIDYGHFDDDPENNAGSKTLGFHFPRMLYSGSYSGQLVEDIRNGKYQVNEGAVIKGVVNGQTYMAKVKTNAYMERLKTQFKDNWKDYWE